MTEIAEALTALADEIAGIEDDLNAAESRVDELEDELRSAESRIHDRERRITELELELDDARTDEVYDLISDVRRGIRDLDELYERALEG